MIAQEKDIADPQTTQKIRAITKAYEEAVGNNDAAAIAALYTADAVFVSDGGPIHGRQAIEKWYTDAFQAWHPKNHVSKPEGDAPHIIGTAGKEVWETGEWSETGQGETGDPIQIKGYWSAIDTREGDDWKIRMLTYNITPASPAETPLSDVEAGTHRLSIAGEGKPTFDVVRSIMARAFQRGELPA